MSTRWTYVLLPALLAPVLLAGCEDNYPKGTRYGFQPYYSKDTKNVTVERQENGQVVQLNDSGAPLSTPTISQNLLAAYGADVGPGQKKTVGLEQQTTFTLNDDEELKAELAELLEPIFGSPREPTVEVETKLRRDPEMRLDEEHLRQGSQLYRRHCLYCHGLNGDGNGPTGQYLNPRPRDFRKGVYKFRSTILVDSAGKATTTIPAPPSRDDLKRTLKRGVPTASMPSFNLLREEDLDALVSYVTHLSLRGMTELPLAQQMASGTRVDQEAVEAEANKQAKRWLFGTASGDMRKQIYQPPVPKATAWGAGGADEESRMAAGREVYLKKVNCAECHANDGRASVVDVPTNIGRMNDWGQLNLPRNLTNGVYRGGASPLDLFWRIKLGISGSGMPPVNEQVTDEEIWQLIDYVMALPTQQR